MNARRPVMRSVSWLEGDPLVEREAWELALRPVDEHLGLLRLRDAEPREIRVFGRRDGVTVEPAEGVRVIEATA